MRKSYDIYTNSDMHFYSNENPGYGIREDVSRARMS